MEPGNLSVPPPTVGPTGPALPMMQPKSLPTPLEYMHTLQPEPYFLPTPGVRHKDPQCQWCRSFFDEASRRKQRCFECGTLDMRFCQACTSMDLRPEHLKSLLHPDRHLLCFDCVARAAGAGRRHSVYVVAGVVSDHSSGRQRIACRLPSRREIFSVPHAGDDITNDDLCFVWRELWECIGRILPEDALRLALDGEHYSRTEFDEWYGARAQLVWRHAAPRTVRLFLHRDTDAPDVEPLCLLP